MEGYEEEQDRGVDERKRNAAAAERAAQAAVLRHRQEDDARAMNAARIAAIAEIDERYYSQLLALEKVPHFAVFWLMGSAATTAIFSVLVARKLPFLGYVIALVCGFIPGLLLQDWATDRKRKSRPYVDLVKQRDAEYEAVNQKYPRARSSLRRS